MHITKCLKQSTIRYQCQKNIQFAIVFSNKIAYNNSDIKVPKGHGKRERAGSPFFTIQDLGITY